MGKLMMLLALPALQDDTGARLKKTVETTLTAEAFSYSFALRTDIPGSDPFTADGTGVALNDRTLFLGFTATGAIDKKIIVGKAETLIWHPFVEAFIPAVIYGDPDAGHGFQNPHELLDVIRARTAGATADEQGRLRLRFEGARAVEVLGRLRIRQRLQAEGTWIEILVTQENGRMRSLRSTARINFVPGAGGPANISYEVTVTVKDYDGTRRPSWPGIDVGPELKRVRNENRQDVTTPK